MHPETEKVYNTAFDLIETRLNKKEKVTPFTVTTGTNPKPQINMYEPGGKDIIEQIKDIRGDLRNQIKSKRLVAVCLCYEVEVTDPRINQKTSAVQMEIASEADGTHNIFIPYDFEDKEFIKKPFQVVSDERYF